MRPLDLSKDKNLKKNGRPVDSFRLVGRLLEIALHISLVVGRTQLATTHLPQTVEFRLDGMGLRDITATEDDRRLAVAVAKQLRLQIHRLGFELKQVTVREGRDGHEHDLVLQLVDDDGAGLVMKKISAEVKMRRIQYEAGREFLRKVFQRECVDECQWWQDAAATGKWSGRMVILCDFPKTSPITPTSTYSLRIDYTPVSGKPRGLFGWRGSSKDMSVHHAPRKSQPVVTAAPKAKAAAPRPVVEVIKKVKKPFPKLKYRWEQKGGRGKKYLVAPVVPVRFAAIADTGHIGRHSDSWVRRCGDHEGACFQAPRSGDKKGGKPEWVATESVLKHIYSL